MFYVRRSLILLPLLLGAGLISADENDAPWHVIEADIRIPVTVSIEEALAWMPPQVYLADLNPIETKDLAFDRKSKNVVKHDIRTQEEKERVIAGLKRQCAADGREYKPELYEPALRANGSATFELKPEYRWFLCEFRGNVQVFVDGTNVFHENGRGIHLEAIPIPPGAKRFRIEANVDILKRAGFITRGPAVARAAFCLPGLDPTAFIPVVHDIRGRRVGCRILWAYPGEPMSILFDCSSGEERYMVYLAPRSKQPARQDWAPKAGLIFESRYPDCYDPAVNTPEGFLKLWDDSGFIAGKEAVMGTWVHTGRWWQPRWQPGAAIFHRFLPFRPVVGKPANFRNAKQKCGKSLALSRYTGLFHVPDTQEYRFLFKALPAGYLFIDDQMVAELRHGETQKGIKLKLEKGLHKLDFRQYGQRERFYAHLCWNIPKNEPAMKAFGHDFPVWEPLAEAATGAATHREEKLFASFTWEDADKEWLGIHPAGDIIMLSLTATLSREREGAVFRWRFDDGHTAEGGKVDHVFFAPGIRKVELEVLDGPGGKTIARAAGDVHVHVNWSLPKEGIPSELVEPIARREKEFASVTPIQDVLSLYEWSLQCEWLERQIAIGAALAKRIDDVIGKYPCNRLLDLARSVPMAAHFSAVESLCNAVMNQAPAGGDLWNTAATTLADILVSVRSQPKEALALLEKVEHGEPILDMTNGWHTAVAKQWHPRIPESGEIADVTAGTNWSKPSALPVLVRRPGDRGAWFKKAFHVPDSRRGKELVLELQGASGQDVAIWFNGKPIDAPAQWPLGPIVIPAEAQRFGETNRFLALQQPEEPPEWNNGAKHLLNFGFALPAAKAELPARIRADALLMLGDNEKAEEILLNLKPDAWPLDELTQIKLSGDLRRVRMWARTSLSDAGYALSVLDEWQRKHPMLRTAQPFMLAKLETYAGMGDYARALTLAGQIRGTNLNEEERGRVMLVQVQSMLGEGNMDAARKVYTELKSTIPYSQAAIAARQAIENAAVREVEQPAE